MPIMSNKRRNTLDDCSLSKLREMLDATERTAPNGPAAKIIREAIDRKIAAEESREAESR